MEVSRAEQGPRLGLRLLVVGLRVVERRPGPPNGISCCNISPSNKARLLAQGMGPRWLARAKNRAEDLAGRCPGRRPAVPCPLPRAPTAVSRRLRRRGTGGACRSSRGPGEAATAAEAPTLARKRDGGARRVRGGCRRRTEALVEAAAGSGEAGDGGGRAWTSLGGSPQARTERRAPHGGGGRRRRRRGRRAPGASRGHSRRRRRQIEAAAGSRPRRRRAPGRAEPALPLPLTTCLRKKKEF